MASRCFSYTLPVYSSKDQSLAQHPATAHSGGETMLSTVGTAACSPSKSVYLLVFKACNQLHRPFSRDLLGFMLGFGILLMVVAKPQSPLQLDCHTVFNYSVSQVVKNRMIPPTRVPAVVRLEPQRWP